MKRNKSHRNGTEYFVGSMVRAAWFSLTALLIVPVYAGLDQMPDWVVLLPLFSIVTALAGIFGFNPLHVLFESSRVDGASEAQGPMVASAR